jgi:hypothetical protein
MLNDYSVADYHERSFFSQVSALARKKIIIMTRDRKSFMMDFFLPILLIITGLYVSTVDPVNIAKYPTRNLSPGGYPAMQPLIYN